MGWCSGGELFDSVWRSVRDHLHPGDLEMVCKEIIEAFENMDCDTISECARNEWPEVSYYIYSTDMDYFIEVCEQWEEDESIVPIHEYLMITKDQYNRLLSAA